MLDARSDRYIRFILPKPLKVIVCAITLVAFVFNIVSYDIAWADRTPSALTSVGADRAVSPVSPGDFKELHVKTFSLPQSLGTIKDSWSYSQHPTPNTQHPIPNTQHPIPNTQKPGVIQKLPTYFFTQTWVISPNTNLR
jgi:hypothetical protein